MAVTQAQVDALNLAIADGVRQVTLPDGQTTTYNTTASLIAARDDMRRELFAATAAAATTPTRGTMTLAYYAGRGYT